MAGVPLYLRLCLSLCRKLAIVISRLHYSLVTSRIIKPPAWYNEVPEHQVKSMDKVWKARITRRFISASVRSFLRKDILKLVNLNIQLPLNSGCVIVICHTPWKRLLIQWCLEQENIQVIAALSWTGKRRSIQNTATGFRELKKAVTHLRQNGRIIITLDLFNKSDDCPVTFFGVNQNVSMFPVRLAQLGQVPLIMAIPVYDEGVVKFIKGPVFNSRYDNLNSCGVMQCLIHDLEKKIKINPSVWSEYVR